MIPIAQNDLKKIVLVAIIVATHFWPLFPISASTRIAVEVNAITAGGFLYELFAPYPITERLPFALFEPHEQATAIGRASQPSTGVAINHDLFILLPFTHDNLPRALKRQYMPSGYVIICLSTTCAADSAHPVTSRLVLVADGELYRSQPMGKRNL